MGDIKIGEQKMIAIGSPLSNFDMGFDSRTRTFSQYSMKCFSFSVIIRQS